MLAGTLIAPTGHQQAALESSAWPPPAAVQWAEQSDASQAAGLVPPETWVCIGVPALHQKQVDAWSCLLHFACTGRCCLCTLQAVGDAVFAYCYKLIH